EFLTPEGFRWAGRGQRCGCQVPHEDRSVGHPGRRGPPTRQEGERADRCPQAPWLEALGPRSPEEPLARQRVPEAKGASVGRGQHPAVRGEGGKIDLPIDVEDLLPRRHLRHTDTHCLPAFVGAERSFVDRGLVDRRRDQLAVGGEGYWLTKASRDR